MARPGKATKKKVKKNITDGILFVNSTFNNTLITRQCNCMVICGYNGFQRLT